MADKRQQPNKSRDHWVSKTYLGSFTDDSDLLWVLDVERLRQGEVRIFQTKPVAILKSKDSLREAAGNFDEVYQRYEPGYRHRLDRVLASINNGTAVEPDDLEGVHALLVCMAVGSAAMRPTVRGAEAWVQSSRTYSVSGPNLGRVETPQVVVRTSLASVLHAKLLSWTHGHGTPWSCFKLYGVDTFVTGDNPVQLVYQGDQLRGIFCAVTPKELLFAGDPQFRSSFPAWQSAFGFNVYLAERSRQVVSRQRDDLQKLVDHADLWVNGYNEQYAARLKANF